MAGVLDAAGSQARASQQNQAGRLGSSAPARDAEIPAQLARLADAVGNLESSFMALSPRLKPVSSTRGSEDSGAVRASTPCSTALGADLAELETRLRSLTDSVNYVAGNLELP